MFDGLAAGRDVCYDWERDLVLFGACSVGAWTAALWHQKGTARCQVLGVEDGSSADRPIATIIAPARTTQRGP